LSHYLRRCDQGPPLCPDGDDIEHG